VNARNIVASLPCQITLLPSRSLNRRRVGVSVQIGSSIIALRRLACGLSRPYVGVRRGSLLKEAAPNAYRRKFIVTRIYAVQHCYAVN
jgi:hypothetical protein